MANISAAELSSLQRNSIISTHHSFRSSLEVCLKYTVQFIIVYLTNYFKTWECSQKNKAKMFRLFTQKEKMVTNKLCTSKVAGRTDSIQERN